MPEITDPRRVLDPAERVSEVLFGLIMALTFTGSLSVASAGREDVHTMLFGALGCSLAWGLVDSVLYVVHALVERIRGLAMLRAVHRTGDPDRARDLIADALPPAVASVMRPADFDSLRRQLEGLPEPPPLKITGRDLKGALGVFLLVFLSAIPVVLPFLFIHEARLALRVSNVIALVMLYLGGHRLGRYMGRPPLMPGLLMVAIGVVLVLATIALGG